MTEPVADGVRAAKRRRGAARRERRVERWRRELGLLPGSAPADADYRAAVQAGDWQRTAKLARLALATPGLSPEQRAAWRCRRAAARGAGP